ncbi:follistatin-like, partial [Anneissia japonica]|uniref:follistatin-like n=1 Tax=Anneissia japonica TaxID=1529436 RepID=UPI001425A980
VTCPVCPKPTQSEKVCGTDGKTYSSNCVLLRKACLQKSVIQVDYKGKCERNYLRVTNASGRTTVNLDPTEPTSILIPTTSTEPTQKPSDLIDTTKTPKKGKMCVRCPPTPSYLIRHVCGSDGKTYPTRCILKRKACLKRSNLTVAYTGKCVDTTTSTITINSGKNTILPESPNNRKRQEMRSETIPTYNTRKRTSSKTTEPDISLNSQRVETTASTMFTYGEDDDSDSDEVVGNESNEKLERKITILSL